MVEWVKLHLQKFTKNNDATSEPNNNTHWTIVMVDCCNGASK